MTSEGEAQECGVVEISSTVLIETHVAWVLWQGRVYLWFGSVGRLLNFLLLAFTPISGLCCLL